MTQTYAAGHTLVKTNNGMLCRDCGGLLGPNAWVHRKATSNEIYVVATKKAIENRPKGYHTCKYKEETALLVALTISELRVPSSTICVATSPRQVPMCPDRHSPHVFDWSRFLNPRYVDWEIGMNWPVSLLPVDH